MRAIGPRRARDAFEPSPQCLVADHEVEQLPDLVVRLAFTTEEPGAGEVMLAFVHPSRLAGNTDISAR
jgi:hypothetical protein